MSDLTVGSMNIKIKADASGMATAGKAIEKFQANTQRRLEKMNRLKVSPTARIIDKISNPVERIDARLKKLSGIHKVTIEAVDKTKGVLDRIKHSMTSLPGLMGMGMAVGGVGMLLGNMMSEASGFQQAMANVASVAGAGAAGMQQLTNAALGASKKLPFSPTEAASALYYLASAGFTVNQQIAALNGTLALSAATQSDLQMTSETLATSLSMFGLKASDASRVANVYAATISASQATMQKLTDAMSYAGPVAAAFGKSIEETSATLGVLMSDAGLTGEQAGTTLRTALVQLANPTGQAVKALQKLHLTVNDVNPATHSLADIIDLLRKRHIDTATAVQLFTKRATGMLQIIKDGGDRIRQMTARVTGTNKAFDMASQQTDTLRGAMKYLTDTWKSFEDTIMTNNSTGLQKVVDYFRNMFEGSNKLANSIGTRLNDAFTNLANILNSSAFKSADWSGKIGMLMDPLITGIQNWLDGRGGKEVQSLFTRLAEMAAKAWVDAFAGALKGAGTAAVHGNFLGAAGMLGIAGLLGGGAVARGAWSGGKALLRGTENFNKWSVGRRMARVAELEKTNPLAAEVTKGVYGMDNASVSAATKAARATSRVAEAAEPAAKVAATAADVGNFASKALPVLGKVGEVAGRLALPLAIASSFYEVATAKNKGLAIAKAAGGLAGGWGGAELGAAIGTAILPGIGTVIGGALGGLGGYLAGHWGAGKMAQGISGGNAAPVSVSGMGYLRAAEGNAAVGRPIPTQVTQYFTINVTVNSEADVSQIAPQVADEITREVGKRFENMPLGYAAARFGFQAG